MRNKKIVAFATNGDVAAAARLICEFRGYQFSNITVESYYDTAPTIAQVGDGISSADVLVLGVEASETPAGAFLTARLKCPCVFLLPRWDVTAMRSIVSRGLRHRTSFVITTERPARSPVLSQRTKMLTMRCNDSAYRAALEIANTLPSSGQYSLQQCPF